MLSTFCKAAALTIIMASSPYCLFGSPRQTVKFNPDTTTVLRNPLQGWVMYLGRNWDSDFWEDQGYDTMITSEGDTVCVSDYASCAYLRTAWSAFEPAEGCYAWNDPDSKLMRLIKSVNDRGLKIAFRIVVDGRDQGQNTPAYVFEAGAKGYGDPKAPERISPYPDDPVFHAKYAKFVEAFASQFDNPDQVAFIDAFSLGKWGESHSMIYENPENKVSVFRDIIDLYSRCFHNVPLVIHYHRMLGDTDADGWADVAPETEGMIQYAVDKGYCLRHDAFGMTDYYQDWEKQTARHYNFKCPIIMEGGWITGAHHRYWRDSSGLYREGHSEDVRHGEYEASKIARVNCMDLRTGDEVRSWFGTSMDLVKGFISEGGYRLYPSSITVPTEVKIGKKCTIEHTWQNHGWGYCPTNIPQMQQKYKVGIALVDSEGQTKWNAIVDDTDLSTWIKEKPAIYTTEIELGALPKGKYSWAVALVDNATGLPALEMAVDQSKILPSGWLPIVNVKVK